MSADVTVEVERHTRVKVTVNVEHSQLIEAITEAVKAAFGADAEVKVTSNPQRNQAMAERCVYERVKQGMTILSDPAIEGASKGERVLYAVLLFTSAVAHAIDSLSQEEIDSHGPAIKAELIEAYNEFLAPIDLPGVPNVVEPMVDQLLASWIGAGADAGIARLKAIHERMNALLAEAA